MTASAPRSVVGFALFLLVNALLLLRPSDIVPDLADVPLYEVTIVACLLMSLRPVLSQLSPQSLYRHPITTCILGLLVAVTLSHLTRFAVYEARMAFTLFAKVVIYYLLFLAVVDTPGRLRVALLGLIVCALAQTLLALLQYHGVIDLPGLTVLHQHSFDTETGELVLTPRLRSIGIYNDPNDLCVMLVVGVLVCIFWLDKGPGLLLRVLGLTALGLFGYGIVLTKSRGGFLALMAGLLTFCAARFGWRKSALLAVAGLPLLVVLAGERQTSISTGEDTARERIQIWGSGFELFKEHPVFGVGVGEFVERIGLVAHNSFLHCFVETGLLGGTCFVGVFFCALASLRRLGGPGAEVADRQLSRMRPLMLGVAMAYTVGLLSLSRPYTASTYLVVGLVAAYLQITGGRWSRPRPRFDGRLLGQLAVASVTILLVMYVFVRLFVRWD